MLDDLVRERIKKLERFRAAGHDPYPEQSRRTHALGRLIQNFDTLVSSRQTVTVGGRIRGLRNQGSVFFADLRDATGKIQLVARRDRSGDYELFRDNLDIGDFLEASGVLFRTQKGEQSLEVEKLKLLAKTLRPLPDQWTGLTDTETRLRQRYLDLLCHPETAQLFEKKARFWETVRSSLKKNGFLEVETPVLELIPGGADAEPFVTHHRTLDADLYLRVSLELPLKKLLVAGWEKVFEVGRIFRNEGMDAEHLQDYTQCEFYWAYQDQRKLMTFVQKFYRRLVRTITGGQSSPWQDQTIVWDNRWPKLDYYKLFREKTGVNLKTASREKLAAAAASLGVPPEAGMSRGRIIDRIYKKAVRPGLIQPAFLVNPPADVEPLAKRLTKDPQRVARFQVVAGGTELGKGFSEANDPLDQRQRFEEQMRLRAGGDHEAQRLDEDFLTSLEYGMPPAAGFGFSERLFALLQDKPLRETTIFPLLKAKK